MNRLTLVPPPPLPTRRSWWSRAARAIHVALLRFEIDSAERWLIECERDGIYDTDTLRTLRNHLAAQRVRLIDMEASCWSST